MIKVKYNNKKIHIRISGHAMHGNHGNDIVCAGVSTLAYTFGNQFLKIDEKNTKVDIADGQFELINNNYSKDNNLLFVTFLNGLKMVEEQYPKNIKIEEVENV